VNQLIQPTQTEQILTLLKEHREARQNLEGILVNRQDSHEWPNGPSRLRDAIAAAQGRLAALPAPDRAEAEAAGVAELERLVAEREMLREQLAGAIRVEMEAAAAHAAAKIRVQYAKNYGGVLGLTTAKTSHAAHEAGLEVDRATYQHQVISNHLSEIRRYTEEHYPGADFERPATFAAAAASRVQRLLGERYDRAEAVDLRTKLGVSDSLLSRLARLAGPA
jgi:hypothetical protein